jgi:hypothetical protein
MLVMGNAECLNVKGQDSNLLIVLLLNFVMLSFITFLRHADCS